MQHPQDITMNDIIISTADHTPQQSELAEALEQLTILCRAVGAHMTLVAGKRRPWVLLVEMTDAILAYVAQYPGAPPYAVGQENAEFKHSIKLATIYEQDMMLGVQLRHIAGELEERAGLKSEERLGLKPTL